MIELKSYLLISAFLFICGIIIMVSRKNIVAVLLGVEFLLNAAALNFVAYSKFLAKNMDGQVFTLFLIVIAAAEAAVGLAIAIRFFQVKETIHLDDATQLQS